MSNAAKNGNEEIVQVLLARNDIDVNAGKLLGAAADQEYRNIVRLMILLSTQLHH